MVDGNSSYEGRLEYCRNNKFGTVCDKGDWDDEDAQVVCNQLGFGKNEGKCKTMSTVFPRIDRARTIYFSALIGAGTNRGRGLIL